MTFAGGDQERSRSAIMLPAALLRAFRIVV
jgi:hypothetical protein